MMEFKQSIDTHELVFIHGAWASGWGWSALIPHLESEKIHCHVLDLPGSESKEVSLQSQASLTDYVDFVCAKMDVIQKPVWLVAHSGGGLTATAVAEAMPDKVLGIIYVVAMMLPSDMSYGDLCAKVAKEKNIDTKGISPYLKTTAFGSYIDSFSAVKQIFLQDATDEIVSNVLTKLVAQPNASRLVSVTWTAERAGAVAKYYIEALNDNSLLLPLQKEMQTLTPVTQSVGLDCGHFPQVVVPEALALNIKAFIN
jgi:pimeloyl-ACP methyl ester carboxylesterase